jgi:glycosyltransferase involved in cell wall biosynthesis
MSHPKISVVVRAYNEGRFIDRLFAGLAAQTEQSFEVILVDSGSTDDTVEIARRFGASVVNISKSEFSFGRSLNLGCAAARGAHLVFASAHVYPARVDWLERLIAPFENERIGLVYGMQRGNELTKFSEHQIFKKWFPAEDVANQSSYFCNNANCAIRRSLWEIHPYDEHLTGLEDLAWAKGLKGRMQVAYSADAEVIHVHDETWDRVRNRYRREAIALRSIEPELRFTAADFVRLVFGNVTADLREARRQRRMREVFGEVLLFRINQFWGTYSGHRFPAPMTAELKDRFYYPHAARAGSGEPPSRAVAAPELRIAYDAAPGIVRDTGKPAKSAKVSVSP